VRHARAALDRAPRRRLTVRDRTDDDTIAMTTSMNPHAATPLDTRVAPTPSERLLLAAAAPDADAAPDAPIVVRVPDDTHVHELLATALLANEQAGAVTLEMGSAKRLFGLRTVAVVRMTPTVRAAATAWPADSLEAKALAAATRLAAKDKHEVAEVCSAVVDWDANPEGDTVGTMIRALTPRGLVAEHAERRTTLKVFKTTHRSTVLSPAGIAALRDAGAPTTLVETCRRERPELWALLWKTVVDTFASKTQRDSGDMSSSD
jgi:hypothetical protein